MQISQLKSPTEADNWSSWNFTCHGNLAIDTLGFFKLHVNQQTCKDVVKLYPIGSMYAIYMVTFTINIPPMLVYIPYMDPMGMWWKTHVKHGDVTKRTMENYSSSCDITAGWSMYQSIVSPLFILIMSPWKHGAVSLWSRQLPWNFEMTTRESGFCAQFAPTSLRKGLISIKLNNFMTHFY